MSYSFTTVALNSRTHYAYDTATSIMQDLQEAFEYMVDTKTCLATLKKADYYRWKQDTFSKELAQKMVYDTNTSPGMFVNLPVHS
jgi:hypothetical protein